MLAVGEVEPLSVPQVEEPGQNLRIGLGVEPDEVLVVALDEDRPPGSETAFGPPRREVARALVLTGRTVDPARIGPDAEVADVQHPCTTGAGADASVRGHAPNISLSGVDHPS